MTLTRLILIDFAAAKKKLLFFLPDNGEKMLKKLFWLLTKCIQVFVVLDPSFFFPEELLKLFYFCAPRLDSP